MARFDRDNRRGNEVVRADAGNRVGVPKGSTTASTLTWPSARSIRPHLAPRFN
jgi:hypothetical protein